MSSGSSKRPASPLDNPSPKKVHNSVSSSNDDPNEPIPPSGTVSSSPFPPTQVVARSDDEMSEYESEEEEEEGRHGHRNGGDRPMDFTRIWADTSKEVKKAQLVIERVNAETNIDDVVSLYGHIGGFNSLLSHINLRAARAYLYFDTEEAYQSAKGIAIPWGRRWEPMGYNPFREHSVYYRVFLSGTNVRAVDRATILNSLESIIRHRPTSATVNAEKNCICVYFESAEAWLDTLKFKHLVFAAGLHTVALRVVLAFTTTSDPAWKKIFVGGLPNGITNETAATFILKVTGQEPEIIALQRDKDSGHTRNYGFVFTRAEIVVHALLGMNGGVVGDRRLRIELAMGPQASAQIGDRLK